MDWLKGLNAALNSIEEQLTGEIDDERAAALAGCSEFHLQRMFSYLAGITLTEHVRRRKMTRAAFDLQRGERVIDVALKYGYDSPTAFNRAFQSIHGVPPSAAKSKGAPLKAYPPISFKILIKGDYEMNYRIEKKGSFKVVGVCQSYDNTEEGMAKIPGFWNATMGSGIMEKLCPLMEGEPAGWLGLCTCDRPTGFDYYIAVAATQPAPEGTKELEIPGCTWAIFECVGPMPSAIQNLTRRIFSEWLPNSGYAYANAPDIEVYPKGDMQSPDYRCEIWLPVTAKA